MKNKIKGFGIAIFLVILVTLVSSFYAYSPSDGPYFHTSYFNKKESAQNKSSLEEGTYTYERGGHRISFLKPKNLLVYPVYESQTLNDIFLYIDSPELTTSDNCSHPRESYSSFIKITTREITTNEESFLKQRSDYLKEEMIGKNRFFIFEASTKNYIKVGEKTVLNIESINPEMPKECYSDGNDFSEQIHTILSTLEFTEQVPRQHNLSEIDKKTQAIRTDITTAYNDGEIKTKADCPIFAKKYASEDQYRVNFECGNFYKFNE